MAPPPGRGPQSPPMPGAAGPNPAPERIQVSPAAAGRIGQKIWQNESGGSVNGLTAWNRNEGFASLGIGHFIWYPAGLRHTYEESFRPLLGYLRSRGVRLPSGLTPATPCPWPNRTAFMNDFQGPRLRELRGFLQATVSQQTDFIIQRMQSALPKLQAAAHAQDRQRITNHFYAVAESPNGVYALIDYVNFKGEGVNPHERYRGQGWGLLQVLQDMRGQPRGPNAAREFSAAAKRVLGRRIANAPKNESQWRAGWFNRCDTYARPL